MLKAVEILKEKREICLRIYNGDDLSDGLDSYKDEIEAYDEAIEELEQYEQNFKAKEFKYRTDCQNVLSAGRVEADNMPDKLAELEKVILDYYLDKGYQLNIGEWGFKVEINSRHKYKSLNVLFGDEEGCRPAFTTTAIISSDMWDKAIKFFSLNEKQYQTGGLTSENFNKETLLNWRNS